MNNRILVFLAFAFCVVVEAGGGGLSTDSEITDPQPPKRPSTPIVRIFSVYYASFILGSWIIIFFVAIGCISVILTLIIGNFPGAFPLIIGGFIVLALVTAALGPPKTVTTFA